MSRIRIYEIDGPPEGCPDCGEPWPDEVAACPSCGLTVEDVSERLAGRPDVPIRS